MVTLRGWRLRLERIAPPAPPRPPIATMSAEEYADADRFLAWMEREGAERCYFRKVSPSGWAPSGWTLVITHRTGMMEIPREGLPRGLWPGISRWHTGGGPDYGE